MSSLITLEGLTAEVFVQPGKRVLVGLAGPPGSGKSTVAEKLCASLNAAKQGTAAISPMDGFHYDDGLLFELGRKDRKGAPDTFDVGGLRHTLHRLKDNVEEAVAVPVFDRDLEISRGSARLISSKTTVVIVEGNYLFLQQGEWSSLRPLFDVTVMIAASQDILRQRLIARWESHKLPRDEILRKVEENDLPNGKYVSERSVGTDYRLNNDD